MRSPLQGGLPPAGAVAGPMVEIACDESGFSGSNLLDPATPVITHASVDLRVGEAAELVSALRSALRPVRHELKCGHLLRQPGAGEALEWFLAALAGRARVHLIDKELFLVTRIVDLLTAEPSSAARIRVSPAALALHRAGRTAGDAWTGFLAAFVDAFRSKRRQPVEPFLRARDALLRQGPGTPAGAVLSRLTAARVHAVRARIDDGDPPLEPMLPALAETVLSWSGGWRRVVVTHDEQSALTAGRLARLQQALADDAGVPVLAGLVMADSRDDPRIQVADLLAGTARRWCDHPLLRPLLTGTSLRAPADRAVASTTGAGAPLSRVSQPDSLTEP